MRNNTYNVVIIYKLCVTLKENRAMRLNFWINILFLFDIMIFISCDFTSPGEFTELSKGFSPDSSRFILKYYYAQGAWDGGRTYLVTVLNSVDSINPSLIKFSFNSLDFDNIYWKNNDSIIVEEKFTEFISQGTHRLNDTVLDNINFKIILKDPIDSSFTRKIFYMLYNTILVIYHIIIKKA